MNENEVRILGIQITDRKKEAGQIQNILTKFGCSIRMRLGLHEVNSEHESTSGIIILELFGDTAEKDKLEANLAQADGVILKRMVF